MDLKTLRTDRGIRMDALALMADCDVSTISRIEAGKARAKNETVVRLAQALGVSARRMRLICDGGKAPSGQDVAELIGASERLGVPYDDGTEVGSEPIADESAPAEADAAVDLEDLRRRLTISVPEAGQLLGIGRDASYAAAERGEIPTLRLGRTLRVPVPKLLELLGAKSLEQLIDDQIAVVQDDARRIVQVVHAVLDGLDIELTDETRARVAAALRGMEVHR